MREGDPASVQTVVTEDGHALAEEASLLFSRLIQEALSARGRARVVLAGGTTPRETYVLLASLLRKKRTPVDHVWWFFGDERWVARDNEQSNEGMIRQALLGPVGAPEDTINSWDAGWGDPIACAGSYGERVRRLMGTEADRPDLVILGLGADGHTASLFPNAIACLTDGTRVTVGPDLPGDAAAVQGAADRGWRLTLSPAFLGSARCVAFLVSGAGKAAALKAARGGAPEVPGSWIRGEVTRFLVTRDAMGPERPDKGGGAMDGGSRRV
jgi:6-phosphogluconolactonase